MDAFDVGDENLFGERPPQEGFDESFVFEDPSFIEDELQNISEEPDVCQPAGHVIMPALLQYAQEKAREDVCETALELSFLNTKDLDYVTCKKRPCNPMNIMKHQESLNRAYGDYVRNKKFETSKQRVKEFEDYLSVKGVCHEDSFRSEGGTPKAFREKIMEFVNEQKIDKIINTAPIDFTHKMDDNITPVLNDPKLQLVVEDSYYPGVIDDAVHKKVDFNKLSFDMSFGQDGPPDELEPEMAPITLLEAFDMRVQMEQVQRQQRMKQENERAPDIKKDCCKIGGFLDFLKERNDTHKVNRDEIMLSTAVDVDLNASLRTTPENDLTRAITCLQRAQVMNSYDKSIQIAELAFVQAPDDLAESAAIIKTNSFIAHVSEQKALESSGQYRPIEIVSYLGVTEPMPGDPMIPKNLDFKVLQTPQKAPAKRMPPPKAHTPKVVPPPRTPKNTIAAKSALKVTATGTSCALPSKGGKTPKCVTNPRSRSVTSKPSSSAASVARSARSVSRPKPGPSSRQNINKPGPSKQSINKPGPSSRQSIMKQGPSRQNIAKPGAKANVAKPVSRPTCPKNP